MSDKDLQKLKENFDVIRYLEDMGVEYSTGGDNVSEGWVGIQCPWCEDHADHLGINLEKLNCSCFICGASNDIVGLIMELEGVGFIRARKRLGEYQEGLTLRGKKEERKAWEGETLPKRSKPIVRGEEPLLVRTWFRRRGFPLDWCREHDLRFATSGEYKLRLIVPVRMNEELVSFQAVDMTGMGVKYVDCPEGRALVRNKHALYGMDGVRGGQVVVVEGVTDKWRMGPDSVALFGKNYTQEQLNLLLELGAGRRVKVVFDADAGDKALRFAKQLAMSLDVMEIGLDEGDPAELDAEGVERILRL